MSVLVGMLSTYREGRLALEALRSVLDAEPDAVFVYEGAAGDELDEEVPASDFGGLLDDPRVTFREGRWRTDARKRTAMLDDVHRRFGRDGSVWGVIVDGDEVLCNGRYLRDTLLRLDYQEQIDEQVEFVGKPMRIVELDGRVSWVRARLLRLDRVERVVVSSSVLDVRGRDGKVVRFAGGGNEPEDYRAWEQPRLDAIVREHAMIVMPPLPCEPFLLHRSALRHPLRSGNRMHEQELDELRRAGLEVAT